MLIIEHRINTSARLKEIPAPNGVEIDLRSFNMEIILEHDPFTPGESFYEWMKNWRGQFLVLNVKEEGLEKSIIDIMTEYKVKDYFFLDQSFPFMQKLLANGNKRTAVRVSDIESVETALVAGTEWCWLDSFSGDWEYLIDVIPQVSNIGLKTCLVSPELQRTSENTSELENLQRILSLGSLNVDAVCTKKPHQWIGK
jgi:hypothetical protein